ncbi:Hypothetical_protein [Hexamita inflata]|uniref:Hypothetical_protein n=1 Tax=Hexamita inflata TaxID=28002 RepID=A0ABP1IZX2_9EUKA
MRLKALDEFNIQYAISKVWKIRHDDLTPDMAVQRYYIMSQDNQQKFWNQIKLLVDLPLDIIQRYFFFTYTQVAYQGNINILKPKINQLIQQSSQITDSNVLFNQIWTDVKQDCLKNKIHPGSVHRLIYDQIKLQQYELVRQKQLQTPGQSVQVKRIIAYMNSPQHEDWDDEELDESEMARVLSSIIKGGQ